MPQLTPQQLQRRDRLDAVLAVGDRVSRIVGPESEYYPIRPAGETFELVPARGDAQPEERPEPGGGPA
jgi:hypothetical protein